MQTCKGATFSLHESVFGAGNSVFPLLFHGCPEGVTLLQLLVESYNLLSKEGLILELHVCLSFSL